MNGETPHPIIQRLQVRRERHLERSRVYRVAFATAGFTVVALGLALLVLPGPGLPVLAIGLAMLALEFTWAERALVQTVDKLEAAKGVAKRASPLQRVAGALALMAATGAAIAAAFVFDLPLLPF